MKGGAFMTIKERFINSLYEFSDPPTTDQYIFGILGGLVLTVSCIALAELSGKIAGIIANNIKK
jgi:hypothetical protein